MSIQKPHQFCSHCQKTTKTVQGRCCQCGETQNFSPSQVLENDKENIQDLFIVKSPQVKKFGRYQIIEEIGRGGMGKVYKAYDPQLDRTVALKLLLTGENSQPKEVARFLREAKATAQLKHPGIITIHDIGFEENQYFFAMEYLQGVSLKEYLKNSSSLRRKIEILKQVTQAIKYAHKKGIIHRDLKPANIMIEDKQAKVMDFGLAKMHKSSQKLSQSGMVIGTLQYMPPEQADGKIRDVDERSDVYSLGVILYEMMTGNVPFKGDSFSQTLYKILQEKPIPPSKLKRRNIPVDLEKICLKALEKKKQNRYQNAQEFLSDLECFLNGEKVKVRKKTILKYALVGILIFSAVLLGNEFFFTQKTKPPKPTVKKPLPEKKQEKSSQDKTIAWWSFDQENLLLKDKINGLEGQVHQGKFLPGKVNQALFLNGNGYVSIPDHPLFRLENSFSLELWCQLLPFSQEAYRVILCKGDSSQATTSSYILRHNRDGTLLFQVSGKNRTYTLVKSKAYQDGKWHHLKAIFESGKSLRLYVDGKLEAQSKTAIAQANQVSLPLYLGVTPHDEFGMYGYYIGGIDEVKFTRYSLQY